MKKRSASLSLLLMGSMALSGCGSDRVDDTLYTFTSMQQCAESGLFSQEECLDLAKSAMAQSPRFASKEECEATFGAGACEGAATAANAVSAPGAANGTQVRHGSGSMWMPMMMGFMAGRFMGGGGVMQGSQGLYRDPQPGAGGGSAAGGSFRTATGDVVKTDASGRVSNPSPRLTQSVGHNARPSMSRSGSGARGGFSGSGGGVSS